MVNRVASPAKLAEYLAAGLALIVTDGIDDTSDILTKENVGLILPSIDPNSWDDVLLDHFLQSAVTDRKGYRKRAVQTAARYFTRADYEKSYRAALFDEGVSKQ